MSARRRVEIPQDMWWRGETDGPLVMEIASVDPGHDEDGTVAWVAVGGVREWPDGTRGWTVELVRAEALPADLLPETS